MGVATQVTDFSDLYTDLLNRVRSETGVSATTNIAKRWINIALHDMHLGFAEKLPWAERQALLITHPEYKTGTAAANEGATALTGASTAWNTANSHGDNNMQPGGKVVLDGGENVFEISSVSDDTTAVLTSNFVGSKKGGNLTAFANAGGGQVTVTSALHGLANSQSVTLDGTTSYNGAFTATNKTDDTFDITATFVADDATGTFTSYSVAAVSYSYFEDEYSLASDFLRPFDQRRFSDGGMDIKLIGRSEFRRRFPQNKLTGKPRIATIVDRQFGANTTPVRKIRFHRPPDDVYVIPYSYITSSLAVSSAGVEATQLSADSDEPIVPLRYRHGIVFHALYHWYRDRSDDVRSQEAKTDYTDIMMRVLNDTEIGGNRPSIAPRLGSYRRNATSPYRGGSGRYDIDGRFDRLEDR